MSNRVLLTLKLAFVSVNYFKCCSFILEEQLPLKSNLGSNPALSLAAPTTLDKLSTPQCLGFYLCKIKTTICSSVISSVFRHIYVSYQ